MAKRRGTRPYMLTAVEAAEVRCLIVTQQELGHYYGRRDHYAKRLQRIYDAMRAGDVAAVRPQGDPNE